MRAIKYWADPDNRRSTCVEAAWRHLQLQLPTTRYEYMACNAGCGDLTEDCVTWPLVEPRLRKLVTDVRQERSNCSFGYVSPVLSWSPADVYLYNLRFVLIIYWTHQHIIYALTTYIKWRFKIVPVISMFNLNIFRNLSSHWMLHGAIVLTASGCLLLLLQQSPLGRYTAAAGPPSSLILICRIMRKNLYEMMIIF